MDIVPLDHASLTGTRLFFAALSPGDLTFIKEDILDNDVVEGWASGRQRGQRWVARADDEVVGFVSVLPLPQWSRHVSELRLVVHPQRRRRGLGTALAQHGVVEAVRSGAEKVVVDAVATDVSTIAMFRGLGFTPEALLVNHIRDRSGARQDLIVLAHQVDDVGSALGAVGVADELV